MFVCQDEVNGSGTVSIVSVCVTLRLSLHLSRPSPGDMFECLTRVLDDVTCSLLFYTNSVDNSAKIFYSYSLLVMLAETRTHLFVMFSLYRLDNFM